HRLGLFDQQTCLLRSRLSLWRSMPFQRYQWGYERDLKLDPFLTQRGSGRARCGLVEGARGLLCGFDKSRTLQRPLSRFAPPFDGRLGEASLREVMRQQRGLGGDAVSELVAQNLSDAPVQDLTPALEEIFVGRVLNERVLETIVGFRRQALDQQNVGFGEPFQRGFQSLVPHLGERAEESVGKPPPDHGGALCPLAGRAKPIEP